MQINQYPIEATFVTKLSYFDIDQILSPGVYQSQKISADNVLGSFLSYMPEILENMYNTSASLTGNREIAQDGFDLAFTGGQVLIGPTSSPAPVRLHVSGENLGAIIGAVNLALTLSSSAGDGLNITAANGRAIVALSPANIFRKQASGVIPSPDPSSLIDSYSPDQGVRIFPPHELGSRDTIASPADGLMIQNNDVGYPEIHHPVYKWQSIGYGRIQLTIDFSVTPLNAGNSWTLSIPTNIPANKVIHKIVAVGDSIADPAGGENLEMGLSSHAGYFAPGIGGLNAASGSASGSTNSNRTAVANEAFVIHYLGDFGDLNSGILELIIFHT